MIEFRAAVLALAFVGQATTMASAATGDRSAQSADLLASTPPPFLAIFSTCYAGEQGMACATMALEEPFRSLSDCLIAIEKVDQGLRRIRSEVTAGTCMRGEE